MIRHLLTLSRLKWTDKGSGIADMQTPADPLATLPFHSYCPGDINQINVVLLNS